MDSKVGVTPGLIRDKSAEPAGRRQRKRLAVRAQLQQEAARLFAAQGYWATTVEQISAAADVAPATFFNHFPTKAALLGETAAAMFDAFAAALSEQLREPSLPTRARLRAFFERAQAITETWRERSPGLLLTMVRVIVYSDEGREQMERLHRACSALVYDGQVRGDVRRDADAAFLADLLRATFVAALINWLNDPRFPLAGRMRQAAAFAGDALSPPGGGADTAARTRRPPRAQRPSRAKEKKPTSGTSSRRTSKGENP